MINTTENPTPEQPTMAARLAACGITLEARRTDRNPNMADSASMDHWACRFVGGLRGRVMHVTFSMGKGNDGKAPTAAEVMDCLCSDAAGIDNASSFVEWASDYGYDTDSRKAESTWKACQRQNKALRRFLLENYTLFVYETERL